MFSNVSPKTKRWVIVLGLLFIAFFSQKLGYHYFFRSEYRVHFYYDYSLYQIGLNQGDLVNGVEKGFLANFVHEGDHFMPFLLMIGQFYKLIPTPIWLFFFASLAVILTLIPILKVGEQNGEKKGFWFALGLTLLYIPFRHLNLDDHYGEIMMTPIMAWTTYFAIQKNWKAAISISFLAFIAKESGGMIPAGLGLYLLLKERDWKKGIPLIAISATIVMFITKWWMPQFVYQGDQYQFVSKYYGYLGQSAAEKIITMATHPFMVLSHIFVPGRILYFIFLLLPLAFLPLFSPLILIGSGILAQILLGDHHRFYDVYSHYIFPVVPVLIMATIIKFHSLRNNGNSIQKIKWIKRAMGFGFIIGILHFTLMEAKYFVPNMRLKPYYQALELIPKNATVSASNWLIPHVLYRDKTRFSTFPNMGDETYVIAEKLNPFWPINGDDIGSIKSNWKAKQYGYVIKELLLFRDQFKPDKRKDYVEKIEGLTQDPNYETLFETNQIIVFKKTN